MSTKKDLQFLHSLEFLALLLHLPLCVVDTGVGDGQKLFFRAKIV